MSLALAIAVYVLVSAGGGLWGARISRRASRRVATGAAAATVLLLLTSALVTADHVAWVNVLPLENVWLCSNPALPGAAMLAALVYPLLPPIRWQRITLAALLLILGVHRSLNPLCRNRLALGPDRWAGETCRQSTKSTCAPAAAASALNTLGVRTTEAALARDAFTEDGGTPNLTLYRALRRATAGTAVRILGYSGPLSRLPTPAVVTLAPKDVGTGLIPIGGRHAVAVLRRLENGAILIADPFSGTQTWPESRLAELWTGSALVLTRTP